MEFTSDWRSMHIPIWQEHFGDFDSRPVRCLEIDSHEGRSAVWIAQHLLSHPSATLTCIDPWPDTEAEQPFDAKSLRPDGHRKCVNSRPIRGADCCVKVRGST